MSNTTLLTKLIDELHEVNCRLTEVSRPLAHLSELSLQQRTQVWDQCMATFQVWDAVNERIRQAMTQSFLLAREATL
jgi:hypothetical protein